MTKQHKSVLITGITGFVGSHLAEYIINHHPQYRIIGLKRWRSPLDNINHIKDKITFYDGDLRDLASLLHIFRTEKPTYIFHLAAQSYVQTSFISPADTMETNIVGTVNLLEAIRIAKLDPIIHICSSSEVYGQVSKQDIPINENCPLRPTSPYAVSKVGEDMVAYMYYQAYGLKTIRSRMFTHTGPRRGEVFVLSAFAKQIAQIEATLQTPTINVGNLDSVRTFSDVRDAVHAYWLLVTKGKPGDVYNIGGNTTMTIRDMLMKLMALTTYPKKIKVKIDSSLLRPADVTLQIPDVSKFNRITKWKPTIPFEQTMQDTLNYWRERISRT